VKPNGQRVVLNRQGGHIGLGKLDAMDGGNQFRFGVAMGRQHPTAKEQHHHYRADNPVHRWNFPDYHYVLEIISHFLLKANAFYLGCLFSEEIMVGGIDPNLEYEEGTRGSAHMKNHRPEACATGCLKLMMGRGAHPRFSLISFSGRFPG
jgi:hypothetical protein